MFRNLHRYRTTVQFTQFSVIGFANGVIDLAALNLLLILWPTHSTMGLFAFNTIAYTLAVINSYIWNSRLTFRREAFYSLREKINFTLQAAVSLLISNGVFLLAEHWFQHLGLPDWVLHNGAKLVSMAFSATASFLFMKFFVFRVKTAKLR